MTRSLAPVDFLAVGPHPDDIEIGIGGLVAKHVALGHHVGLCDLTAGEMGSNGTVPERLAEADAAWKAAAQQATSADLEYLANFLLGWTAMLRGDDKQAVPALTSALEARPDSQSATVALASLEFRAGAAEQAYTRAQASLTAKPQDDDPWRLFLYGHHPQLPSLITQLRQQVSR